MKEMNNAEEEKYNLFLERIKKTNFRKVGVLKIIVGSYISIISFNNNIIFLKVISSFICALGIVEIALDFSLKANCR